MPIVSIISITYKDPEGILRTIDSLRNFMEFKDNWQHIVVDSSPEITRGVLTEANPPWHLDHRISPPQGIYAALNLGAENATGEWLWFLNGGDQGIHVDKLLGTLKACGEKTEAVLFDAEIWRHNELRHQQSHKGSLQSLLSGYNRICHQALLVRRSVLERLGPFDTKFPLAADYEYSFRLLKNNVELKHVPLPIVRFDQGGASMNTRQAMREFKQIQDQNKDCFHKTERALYKGKWLLHNIKCELLNLVR